VIGHRVFRIGSVMSGSFLLAVLVSMLAHGATYYVATSGSDADPGTEAQSWRTIQKAAVTLIVGDTVYVKAGTYKERVVPQNSGNPGNYIAYIAYPGDTVTIDGTGISVPDWGGLFDVSYRSYIKVSGFRIKNSRSVGIFADRSSHIIIEKNYTCNTVSSGIGVWDCSNIIIDGNEVELACNDRGEECITVAVTDTFEIKNNHVHHGGPGTLGGEGIDAKDGSSNGKIYQNHVHDIKRLGIYVDAWDKHTYNIDVFRNIVHDSAAGFSVASEAGGLLENVRIYNNIAYNNGTVGITIADWGEPVAKHPMKDIKVINNTFYNNGSGDWGGGISVENPSAENVVIRNNICSQNLSFQIAVEAGVPAENLTVDRNLIDGYRQYPGEIYGSDYVEGNPMFVNPSGADFHLQKDSPAVDNGSDVDAPGDDFDGNPRPQVWDWKRNWIWWLTWLLSWAGYDIGAFEFMETGVNGPSNGK